MPEFEDIRPRPSSAVAQNVGDFAGGVAYGGQVEGSTGVAFGGPTADFILHGVVNGAFAQGPPDPNDYIDPQINPLPYWNGPTQLAGGATQCTWVADSASPSGYNLRFILNPGAAGDGAYVEQIVPIGGDRAQWLAHWIRVHFLRVSASTTTSGDCPHIYLNLAYLNAAGSITGTESTSTSTVMTADGTLYSLRLIVSGTNLDVPADATLLRIRVGIGRGADASVSGVLDLVDVRVDGGRSLIGVGEGVAPATYSPGYFTQESGLIGIYPQSSQPGFRVGPNYILVPEGSAPTPGSGYHAIYAKTDNHLYAKSDVGVEYDLEAHVGDSITPFAVDISGNFGLEGVITPSISADQNDWSPTGLGNASVIIVKNTSGSNKNITGLDGNAFSFSAFVILACDASGSQITLKNDSASSSAGNRFHTAGADLVIPAGGAVVMQQATDGGSLTRWRVATTGGSSIAYAEGTWTPVMGYATPGSSSWSVTTQTGWYTKIGNRVFWEFTYTGVPTNGTASGQLRCDGLPFTVVNTTGESGAGSVAFAGYTKANYTAVQGRGVINTTQLQFVASGSGQALANLTVGDIPSGGTVSVQGAGFYAIS